MLLDNVFEGKQSFLEYTKGILIQSKNWEF